MIKTLTAAAATLAMAIAMPAAAAPPPTIVLVHGAFADGGSWTAVAAKLRADHYPVIVAANPLRGVEPDSAAVAALLKTIKGPVVLVGHSYGGAVISNAAQLGGEVKALVYVAGFAPDVGESALALSGKFPGSALGEAIMPAPLPDGADLYIRQDRFPAVFAADVAPARAQAMAASQRPVTQAALAGPSKSAAWRTIPSWSVYGDADLCIPPAALAFMAERAHAKTTVVIKGASHALAVSHPDAVVKTIEQAASSVGS